MIENPTLREQAQLHFPFLAENPAFAERFFATASHASLPAGTMVCRDGMACEQLPLVLTGTVRVYKMGASGREVTLYRLHTGDSCILTASCILSALPFPAFAVMEDAFEALLVPAGEVARWTDEVPAWRQFIFGLIALRLADILTVVDQVAFGRLDQRIAARLLSGMDDSGHVALTHQQIADEVGSSREVVSRLLKELEHRGLIRIGRGSVTILASDKLRAE